MNRDVRTINATDEASTRTWQGMWRGSGSIDDPVAVVGMGAQGDGERALAARRVAMAGGSEQVTQGERERKNSSTKLSSILTIQNSKFHIET